MVTLFHRLETRLGGPVSGSADRGILGAATEEASAVRFERTASFPPGLEARGEPNTKPELFARPHTRESTLGARFSNTRRGGLCVVQRRLDHPRHMGSALGTPRS